MRRGEGKKEISEGREEGGMEEVRKGGKWIEEGGTCMCREGGRKYGWVEIK